MTKVLLLSSLLISLFVLGINSMSAQERNVPVRLKDVRTVYVDDASFRFLFSSCATVVGKMVLPCAQHAFERDRFLAAFKRWLIKSGFSIAETKAGAEGIVQGTLSIDERGWRGDPSRDSLPDQRRAKKDDDDCDDETR